MKNESRSTHNSRHFKNAAEKSNFSSNYHSKSSASSQARRNGSSSNSRSYNNWNRPVSKPRFSSNTYANAKPFRNSYSKSKDLNWIEISGRTLEEAKLEAANRFQVSLENLKVEILDEGNKGFLGIGSKPTRIKVALHKEALPSFVESIVARLLKEMDFSDQVHVQHDADGKLLLNIQGPSSATLIGRHGHTLEALQYLTTKIVQRLTGEERIHFSIDVENYLNRQKEKLIELAKNIAFKAKEIGSEIPLRPMDAKDRRIIHITLKDHPDVTTQSRGEGLRRRVIVIPKLKTVAPASPASTPEASPTTLPLDSESASPTLEEPSPSTMSASEAKPVSNIDDNFGNR
jgi:spoIIIJ-associated protein